MKTKSFPLLLLIFLLILMGVDSLLPASPTRAGASLGTTQLSGYVYEGAVDTLPPVAIPLSGVTVRVYGATQPDMTYGDLLNETTTQANGSYVLQFTEARYTYYNIVEVNPSGYVSVGARSVGGVVKTNNWIQYTAPISGTGKVTSGNNFWDQPRVTPTPTLTPTRTPRTPTPTNTPVPRTPTPTETSVPGCEHLQPDFKWEPDPPCWERAVYFHDLSTSSPSDPIVAWAWDFGNGQTSTLQNPYTKYSPPYMPGIYQVRLTVTTQSGCRKRVIKEVNVVECSAAVQKACFGPQRETIQVGDLVTCTLLVRNSGSVGWSEYWIWDDYRADFLEFVAASPPCDPPVSWLNTGGEWHTRVQCHVPTALGPQEQTMHTLTFRAKRAGEDICDRVAMRFRLENELVLSGPSAEFCVDIVPTGAPQLSLTKTLREPMTGVVDVGGLVRYEIRVENKGSTTVTGFSLEDTFQDAHYDFVSAAPLPAVNTSDGTTHTLRWQNITLVPGGVFVAEVTLRAKMPGVTAPNCATVFYSPGVSGVPTPNLFAPLGPVCAEVRIRPRPGRSFIVWKKFIDPTNHVANLGQWLYYQSGFVNTGSEPVIQLKVIDHLTPPTVSWAFPWSWVWNQTYASGDWQSITGPIIPETTASPLINTADWTVTWPDGTTETASAQDYMYIVDGPAGKGLFIDKWVDALDSTAKISDTLSFHIVITNVTGNDLAVVPLEDTFPAECLSFVAASPPPDSVLPGKLVWNNVGPLPLGASTRIDLRFHAAGVCPEVMNCATARYTVPGIAPYSVADCARLAIGGNQPRLVIDKWRTTPSPAMVGDIVSWTVVVANKGNAPLPVVLLHDAYQVGFLEFQSALPMPDTIDPATGRMDWVNVGPLNPGQAVTVTIRTLAKAPGVGVRNCADSTYTVGSSTMVPWDCDTVDIRSPRASIEVDKVLTHAPSSSSLAVGEVAAFSVTVRNTGMVTLTQVVVEDHFDPACWAFVDAPGMMTTVPAPGVLRWEVAELGPGEARSWFVYLRAIAPCRPTENCVHARGMSPEGLAVQDESCVPLRIEALRPGLEVRKAMLGPTHVPAVGEMVRYELVVRNTGNTSLTTVQVLDSYDVACLRYVTASPLPDSVDLATGQIRWDNVGPLAPGEAKTLTVFLEAIAVCEPALNCGHARAPLAAAPPLEAHDCVEVPVRAAAGPTLLYLPVVMKNHPRPAALQGGSLHAGEQTR